MKENTYTLRKDQGAKKNCEVDFFGLVKLAKKGDALAMFALADCYMSGNDAPLSHKQGMYWLEKGAKKGFARAIGALGGNCLDRSIPYYDKERGFQLLREAVGKGDLNAKLHLGEAILNDYGSERNEAEAFRLISEANEELDSAYTNWALAHCYLMAYGTEKNKDKAIELLFRSAEKGYVPALKKARMLRGPETPDAQELEEWAFRDKVVDDALAGDPAAQYELSMFYLCGCVRLTPFPRIFSKGMEYLQLSAESGFPPACYALYEYHIGEGRTEEAIKWCRKAAEGDLPLANSTLGYILIHKGQLDEGLKLYNHAVDQGNADAMAYLAFHYRDGFGVETDYAKSIELFEKSVELNFPVGYYGLGLAYLYGLGVEVNVKKAYKLLVVAANSKIAEAKAELGKFYMGLFGIKFLNEQLAEQLLIEAGQRGTADAYYWLSKLYKDYMGEPQMAKSALEHAAELGCEMAIDELNGKTEPDVERAEIDGEDDDEL